MGGGGFGGVTSLGISMTCSTAMSSASTLKKLAVAGLASSACSVVKPVSAAVAFGMSIVYSRITLAALTRSVTASKGTLSAAAMFSRSWVWTHGVKSSTVPLTCTPSVTDMAIGGGRGGGADGGAGGNASWIAKPSPIAARAKKSRANDQRARDGRREVSRRMVPAMSERWTLSAGRKPSFSRSHSTLKVRDPCESTSFSENL